MDIEIGGETLTKKPNILEEIAYRDTWGKGADSFIAMIYERLVLMRDLLANDGSIYVHCDWRVNHHLRQVLQEVFNENNFRADICWKKATKTTTFNNFGSEHDTILLYARHYDKVTFNQQFRELAARQIKQNYVFVEKKDGSLVRLSKKQLDGLDSMPEGRRLSSTFAILYNHAA